MEKGHVKTMEIFEFPNDLTRTGKRLNHLERVHATKGSLGFTCVIIKKD
jgi:hypothetical protein